MKRIIIICTVALTLAACSKKETLPETAEPVQQTVEQNSKTDAKSMLDPSNPFAAPSGLPFGIVDFSKLKSEHFQPAIEAGMAQQRTEIDAIANQTAEPTFENTIAALEKSGDLLNRSVAIFGEFTNAMSDPVIDEADQVLSPKLAEHSDAILLNDKLFQRIKVLYDKRDTLGLDPESLRLLEIYYRDFVRAGALLTPEQKEEIKKINTEIASLVTQFGQNLLNEKNDSSVVVDSVEELKGLSDDAIKVAAEAAKSKGLEGKYLITIQNTSIQPILKSLDNRDLRKRIHEASINRGVRGNAYDNRAVAIKILQLRAKRSELLGYPNFAAYAVEDQMAKNVDAVNDMLGKLVPAAKASMEREAAELQKIIDKEKGKFKLEAYDWLYYAEKLRKDKYALDDEALKPYFELNNVIENGVFYAAEQLYGVKFVEHKDVPTFAPDARVWEIQDADGKPLALFFGDYYARESKRGGAWMNDYIMQSKLMNQRPVISNQINITKPVSGPTLLTFEEVTTLFHEFGHALHATFSDVQYPFFSGTNVPRDFVEFPSQFNETWAYRPEVLEHFAKHYETGATIPKELLDKVIAAAKFNQGYLTTEYLSASVLDQLWHQKTAKELESLTADDFEKIEQAELEKVGLNTPLVPPRYRSTYFNHIFASGYSAGYYAYIWAEVLDADAEQWFKEHGMSRENGDHYRKSVLSKGYSEDPMKLYRDFTGRDPAIDPLLVRRGLK